MNLFICIIFKHNIFAADKAIHNFQYLKNHKKYSNQFYLIILIIENKQTLIRYCKASSFPPPRNSKTEYNYVNFLSVFVTLLLSLFRCYRQQSPFLWLCLSASVPHGCCRCRWVSYCWRRLVVVFIVGFSSSFPLSMGLFLLAASCCCCCCRLLRIVVVVGVLLLLSVASLRRSMKIFFIMNTTTVEPQYQTQNGNAALFGVGWLNLGWPSPQYKLTYPVVPKFQRITGTNREVIERVSELFFCNRCPD